MNFQILSVFAVTSRIQNPMAIALLLCSIISLTLFRLDVTALSQYIISHCGELLSTFNHHLSLAFSAQTVKRSIFPFLILLNCNFPILSRNISQSSRFFELSHLVSSILVIVDFISYLRSRICYPEAKLSLY